MEGCGLNQGFHKRTKMLLLTFIPTLSSRIAVVFFFLHHMVLVNIKLNIIGSKRNTFQSCRPYWSSPFLMVFLYFGVYVKTSCEYILVVWWDVLLGTFYTDKRHL